MTSKEKAIEYTRSYALKHPGKVAANALRQKQRKIDLYRTDPNFRQKQKTYSKARYAKKREEINARRRASEKDKAYNRAYNRRETRRRSHRDRALREKYGITIEQYDALVAQQNGSCAICGGDHTPDDRWKSGLKNLRVDHDHETGAVRGLLCFHCNTGLGHFRDNPDLLSRALAYLNVL